MSKDKTHTIEQLLKKARGYIEDEVDIKKIEKAYNFAEKKHRGQFRKNGDPFIVHPIEVAVILTTVYADSSTIAAGLLHDVLEDTDTTREELEEEFGPEITKLVYGVTKLGQLNFSCENEYLIEYYKKIVVGMSEDVRVIIIKLAERLHNMRTLFALPEERQKLVAKETLEILAPIAHHLGIHKIKSELEDLSLRYLKPDVFYDIAEKLNNTKLERDNTVNEMLTSVSNLLTEHHIPHEIKGRAKSIYSIYNKLDKGKKFSDIYDLLALRIIVETEQECYVALGLIHSKYRPYPKRFKDYIAMPKANMYQSLHTTVFGVDGYLFEIQIRTHAMDEVAENGIASHWAYKEHKNANEVLKNSTEQKLQFFKAIIDSNNDKMSSEEVIDSIKDEVLDSSIYVFTPKGDVFELPKGATPIDFAYKVHTQVGDTMVGAIVNNNIVPLDYTLQNNDIVKINTNKNSKGPSQEWLKIARCAQTKNKIRAFFTKSEKEINLERGKEALEKELRKRKIAFNDFDTDENKDILFKELKVDSLEEIELNIGNGKFQASTVLNLLERKEEPSTDKIKKITIKEEDADILVAGIDKVKVNLAACCNPIPQDEIIGYITKGNGITVHRSNCHNLALLENRTVAVKWNSEVHKRYVTTIIIETDTSKNNLLEIMQHTSMQDAPSDRVVTINKSGNAIYELDLYVRSVDHLNKVIQDLKKLRYITKVERIIR